MLRSENGIFFVYSGANFAWGVEALKGCGPCPPAEGGREGQLPQSRTTKAKLVIL